MKKTMSQHELRKRKMLLMLPALVLPFVTLLFWALGGGKAQAQSDNAKKMEGLNLNLPDAKIKEPKQANKLSFYDLAEKDSLKLQEQEKNDPFFQLKNQDSLGFHNSSSELELLTQRNAQKFGQNFGGSPEYQFSGSHRYSDPNEEKVMSKLSELNKALNTKTGSLDQNTNPNIRSQSNYSNYNEMDHVEDLISSLHSENSSDPEMDRINGMLDKIMAIQNPEKTRDSIKQVSMKNKGKVFTVSAVDGQPSVTRFPRPSKNINESGDTIIYSTHYSLTDENNNTETQGAVPAIIPETQVLVNGATVKLMLNADIYVAGVFVPQNTFVFGQASLNGERLTIDISSIQYNNMLLPVSLTVYGLDGMQGIDIPGSITRDAAKESANRAIQQAGVTSIDPSFGAQAAAAGIETAKTLLIKKAKLVKVTIKAGYLVLLKDNQLK